MNFSSLTLMFDLKILKTSVILIMDILQ